MLQNLHWALLLLVAVVRCWYWLSSLAQRWRYLLHLEALAEVWQSSCATKAWVEVLSLASSLSLLCHLMHWICHRVCSQLQMDLEQVPGFHLKLLLSCFQKDKL